MSYNYRLFNIVFINLDMFIFVILVVKIENIKYLINIHLHFLERKLI